MIAYVVLAALQVAAVPAAAAPSAPAMITAANAANKMICRQEDEVGTRLGGHKVCMTKAQWRENALLNHDELKHAQDDRGYVHN